MTTMIRTGRKPRICQGDILRDVEMIEYAMESEGNLEISKIRFPLVIVLTQDCDLEQDHRFRWARNPQKNSADKYLISVLVAPLYNAEHVYLGQHLSELKMPMETINKNKTPGKNLRKNNNPRYHFISFSQTIVDSIIDFKHYFSVNVRYLHQLRKTNFVCRIAPLFREDVSQRFSAYLSRIGLPTSERDVCETRSESV